MENHENWPLSGDGGLLLPPQSQPLHPPSFFEAPQKPVGGRTLPVVVDELPSLRQENNQLRQQLEALSTLTAPSQGRILLHQHTSPSRLPPAAVLTTDLLQVEAHLQSKVRLLEEERTHLSNQVLELERTLVETREQNQSEVATLRSQHEEVLSRVQLEADRLGSECRSLRGEREAKVVELEGALATKETQHGAEMETLCARIAELEQNNRALLSDLESERSNHEGQVSELSNQLAARHEEMEQTQRALQDQIRSLESEVSEESRRVQQLEAYLGGQLPQEGAGVTWREERETLLNTIAGYERDRQRSESEAGLLNIRLSSLSEILSIQETDLTKNGMPGAGSLKSLLTRWREKVFVLLVQQKLQQIEDSRARQEASSKETVLLEQQSQLKRDNELLSHSLADRTAELQLQTTRTLEAQEELQQAHSVIRELEVHLQSQQEQSHHVSSKVQEVAEVYGQWKSLFDQALSRLANYEHRLGLASRRIISIKASVACHFAMCQRQVRPPGSVMVVDGSSQTNPTTGESMEGINLTSLSREQLVQEVSVLTRERDSLAEQLTNSTAAFKQQLQSLTDTCSRKLSLMEERVDSLQCEKSSLSDQLSELQSRHSAVGEERTSLQERVVSLEGELREAQATLEARVEVAVLEEQQRSSQELSEMEKLLNVAKREHAKTVVQLQQVQRQVERDRERAVQAVELGKAQVEHELESCRRKLQSLQAERNLLLTTLRQEGIMIPSKRPPPRRPKTKDLEIGSDSESEEESVIHSDKLPMETQMDNGTIVLCSETEPHGLQVLQSPGSPTESGGVIAVAPERLPETDADQQDIREVLKDLQQLSASLLGLEQTGSK